MIQCKICGKEFKKLSSLSGHLIIHNYTSKQYYDEFLKKDEHEGICNVCKKNTKFQSITRGYAKCCSYKCSANDPRKENLRKKTCLKKYGTEFTHQNKNIIKKLKETLFNRTDAEIDKSNEKRIHTCRHKYSVDNPFQVPEFQKKFQKTIQKKYGVDSINQLDFVKEKKRKTCSKHYGFDHFTKTFEARKLARETQIKRVEQQKLNGEPLYPNIGKYERKCLNELQKYTDFEIKRNPKIIGYFPDGYIEELKIDIEFDEEHHQYSYHKKPDNQRDQDMNENQIRVFRISKKEWNENPSRIIKKFQKILGEHNV
jgi:very-short-patch-repair endonuclease